MCRPLIALFCADAKDEDDEEELRLFSQSLVAERRKTWPSDGPPDWRAEFIAVYTGGAAPMREGSWPLLVRVFVTHSFLRKCLCKVCAPTAAGKCCGLLWQALSLR